MRQSFPLVFCSFFALGVVATTAPGCKKPEYPSCKKDKHCKVDEGEKCVDGTCQNCTSDEDCKGKGPNQTDWKCHELRCTDPTAIPAGGSAGAGTGKGEVGAPCTQRTDCVGGLACKEGKCDSCSDDIDCAPNTCTMETGRCSPEGQCKVDDDCPMEQICDGGMCIFSGDVGKSGEVLCGLDAVYFAFDSDSITPAMKQKLEGAAGCIKDQNRAVELEAHADAVGTEEYNILLTERRGRSVMEVLTTLGVPGDKLKVIAKGSLEAVGTDEPTRAKERRVSFIWR